jgi:hypothetical protein
MRASRSQRVDGRACVSWAACLPLRTAADEPPLAPGARRSQPKARLIVLFASLVISAGGCAVTHDLGFRPGDASLVIPQHNYMPRNAAVCAAAPAFYGYHATCWSPWPDGWEGCPPLWGTASATDGDLLSPPQMDMPTPAPGDSALRNVEPSSPGPPVGSLAPVPERTHAAGGFLDYPRTEGSVLRVANGPSEALLAPAKKASVPPAPNAQGLPTEPFPPGDLKDPEGTTVLTSGVQEAYCSDQSDWLLWVEEDDSPAVEAD